MSVASRLYHGDLSIDFVGRWRAWFLVSAVAMAISIVAFFVPGLNFGIQFKGGDVYRAQAHHAVTVAGVTSAIGSEAKVVQLAGGSPPEVIVTTPALSETQIATIRTALSRVTGDPQISVQAVGPTWGSLVTQKALIALAIFLVAIMLYVSIRFEFKMAIASLVSLIHDIVITIGVYALTRFQVTSETVVAVLTILGYSMYDTVVVFDKVRENTAGFSATSRSTWSALANKAMNQTIVRSLNTSLASLLPIAALLIVGELFVGASTIKQLALALLVGILSGTYSSIFIATPFLALWKEREPTSVRVRKRIESGMAGGALQGTSWLTPTPALDAGPADGPRDAGSAEVSVGARRANRPDPQAGTKAAARPGNKRRRR